MKNLLIYLFLFTSSALFSQQGWYFLNPTPTGNAIIDIKMFNENTGICITAKEVLRTTNGGVNWDKIKTTWAQSNISLSMIDSLKGYILIDTSIVVKTTNGGLNWYYVSKIQKSRIGKIYFTSDQTGFALQYDNYIYNWPGKIFRTTNSGKNWDSVKAPSSNELRFYNIFFSSPLTGFVTGIQRIGDSISRSFLLKTINGGEKWDSIPNQSNFDFGPIFFTGENTGYSGANYRIIKTTNGGQNWSYTNFVAGNISCIQFFTADIGFVATGNTFGKTTNGGTNWLYTYGTDIRKFNFINSNTALGTGPSGQFYKTSNSGNNWAKYSNSFTDYAFDDVDFCDKDNGYTISWWNNKILRTTNGGSNWKELNFGATNIVNIANVNPNVCYISQETSNNIYKTTNGGENWKSIQVNGPIIFNIKFLNENTGFGICKYGYFFKTTNGGQSWFYNSLYTYESRALDFIDENTGIIGGSLTYKTTNGGLNWTRLNMDMSIYDVQFVTNNTIFALEKFSFPSRIAKSIDGGLTWQYTTVNLSYATRIKFPNEKTGYVIGSNGVYKTTNQGTNWFEINSGYEYVLKSFDFVDSLTGYSVGSNGVILKTTDGGGTTPYIPPFPAEVPDKFYLHQNYPNPFNPTTKIKFDLPKEGNVKIIIFDILGRQMEILTDEKFSSGVQEVQWNAAKYSAGVYFYMLLTDNIKETKKMILVK